MDITIDTIAKLAAPIVAALIGFLLKRYFESKPILITYLVHATAIPLRDESNTNVNTHSIVVRNTGKKTAFNVRIGHNHLPISYNLFPSIKHEVLEGPEGKSEILIPTLVPEEQVNISYLYFPPITWKQINSYCKSDEMQAKYVNVIPSPRPAKPLIALLWTLIFIGASTTIYWLFHLFWLWITHTN